jgi:chorismate--pyruvate lyase
MSVGMKQYLARLRAEDTQARQDLALLWPWLSTPDSLTAKAMRHGKVQVHQLSGGCRRADVAQKHLLQLSARQLLYQREILLTCDERPWWFGRTIMPFHTTQNAWRLVKKLGNKSLGSVLFHTPQIQRQHAWISPVYGNAQLPVSLLNDETHDGRVLWSKSTRYCLADAPLVVTEIFLPTMLAQLRVA